MLDWKQKNKSALFASAGIQASAAGMLKCPRCKSLKTDYYQKQTRSADEPMTTFANCSSQIIVVLGCDRSYDPLTLPPPPPMPQARSAGSSGGSRGSVLAPGPALWCERAVPRGQLAQWTAAEGVPPGAVTSRHHGCAVPLGDEAPGTRY